jgi:hypothetical protein
VGVPEEIDGTLNGLDFLNIAVTLTRQECEEEGDAIVASFLLNPNRLNVAVSRAEALAIVVGIPELMDVRCRSVEDMKLVNLLCHLVQYAEEQAGSRLPLVTLSEAKGA